MNLYTDQIKSNVILLGDIMLDHNIQGTSTKIANEAPIPVIHSNNEVYQIGGCGNVLANLIALGCQKVFLFSKIGKDLHGDTLIQQLPSNVEHFLTIDSLSTTTTKHRIYSDKKLMCRYDNELYRETTIEQEDLIINQITTLLTSHNISSVLFSDYNKGFLTETLCQRVITLCNRHSIPSIVDPKQNYRKYLHCTVIKPNRMETKHIFNIDLRILPLEVGHQQLHDLVHCKTSIITLSEDGISAYSNQILSTYREEVKEIIDVTGAGDIVCSVLGYYYPFIKDISLLIRIASHLASISISHLGVYTITPYDLIQTYRTIYGTKQISISSLPQLPERVIFTNGCFDLLHSAHVELFKFCKKLGGIVIVGLNSDASIKRLKGESRPIYSLKDRITILEALEYIDFIIPFEEDTPFELIRAIQPHYLVKGGDYTSDSIIGREYAKEIVIFNYIHGKSTTSTIQRVQV